MVNSTPVKMSRFWTSSRVKTLPKNLIALLFHAGPSVGNGSGDTCSRRKCARNTGDGMHESSRGRKRVVFVHLKEEKTSGDIHESLRTRGCTWTSSTPSNRVIAINSRTINHKNESLCTIDLVEISSSIISCLDELVSFLMGKMFSKKCSISRLHNCTSMHVRYSRF
jgi:hypothetical protein